MESPTSSSVVGAIKMANLWVPKINGDSWHYAAKDLGQFPIQSAQILTACF